MPKREERIIIYQGHIHVLPDCDDLESPSKFQEKKTKSSEDRNIKSQSKNT